MDRAPFFVFFLHLKKTKQVRRDRLRKQVCGGARSAWRGGLHGNICRALCHLLTNRDAATVARRHQLQRGIRSGSLPLNSTPQHSFFFLFLKTCIFFSTLTDAESTYIQLEARENSRKRINRWMNKKKKITKKLFPPYWQPLKTWMHPDTAVKVHSWIAVLSYASASWEGEVVRKCSVFSAGKC